MAKYLPLEAALAAKYPFATIPDPDGEGWSIVFPDIPGAIGFATEWTGIGAEAQLILSEWLTAAAEDGYPLPAPSADWDPVDHPPEAFVAPKLASAEDVAAELGLSRRRVIELAHSRGVGQVVGNSFVFTPEEIDALRERRPGRPPKHSAAASD